MSRPSHLSTALTVLVTGAALGPTILWPQMNSDLTNHENGQVRPVMETNWLVSAADAARFSVVRGVADTVAEVAAAACALAGPKAAGAQHLADAEAAADAVALAGANPAEPLLFPAEPILLPQAASPAAMPRVSPALAAPVRESLAPAVTVTSGTSPGAADPSREAAIRSEQAIANLLDAPIGLPREAAMVPSNVAPAGSTIDGATTSPASAAPLAAREIAEQSVGTAIDRPVAASVPVALKQATPRTVAVAAPRIARSAPVVAARANSPGEVSAAPTGEVRAAPPFPAVVIATVSAPAAPRAFRLSTRTQPAARAVRPAVAARTSASEFSPAELGQISHWRAFSRSHPEVFRAVLQQDAGVRRLLSRVGGPSGDQTRAALRSTFSAPTNPAAGTIAWKPCLPQVHALR